jgi:hypothetical protein
LSRHGLFPSGGPVWVAFLLTFGSDALGAPTLSGRWEATGLSSKWVDGEWGEHCGPKPASGPGGSGSVTLTQSGSELTLTGGGRTYSTTQCWTTEPGMAVASHTAGARSWKTTCKSPPGAARQVTTTTSLTATDDTITLYETGQYQFMVGANACTASVGRYRTYRLQQRAGASEQGSGAAEAARQPSDESRCAQPGAVHRVEIVPARRLMRAGDTFTFKATGVDAGGCRIKKKPRWTIEGAGTEVTVDADGTVSVSEGAPEAEADVRVTIGQKSATARVEIASRERFEALLAHGAEEPAPAARDAPAVASKILGAEAAVAEDHASGRKWLFLALIGLAAVGLGLAGIVVLRRSRTVAAAPASSRRPSIPSPVSAPAPPPESAAVASAPQPASDPPKKLCPICGRQYPVTSQFCGQDGANLIPLN